MFEILLLGLAVVVVYAISHYTVMWLERLAGKSLGMWRSVLFFFVFVVLFLAFRGMVWFTIGTP